MALVTGGTPKTVGAFYDVAYDRILAPPASDTGNGLLHGNCVAGQPNGTRTEYEEGVDLDQTQLGGGYPGYLGLDGGYLSIDPNKLPRDPMNTDLMWQNVLDVPGWQRNPGYSWVGKDQWTYDNQPIQRYIDEGIPGIRYADQKSRGLIAPGTATYNYAIWDPRIIKILRKYGLAGLATGAGAGGMMDAGSETDTAGQ